MRISAGIIFLVLISGACFADADIYLYPNAVQKSGMRIYDIAKIEADLDTLNVLMDIVIDERSFSDGYIDRKELQNMMGNKTAGTINIYGSGVRILQPESGGISRGNEIIIQKGKIVRFQVVNSLVRVETMGTALQEGARGDIIPVKLKNTTVSRGKIVNDRTVELAL